MTLRLESIGFRNPTTSYNAAAASMPLPYPLPASLGFKALLGAETHCKIPIVAFPGARIGVRWTNMRNRSVFSFAASREESKTSDIDVENEKEDPNVGAQESEEAWQQALAAFQEQTLKMQALSKEAYELYSKKAIIILKESSESFKIQAEKARQDLSVVAKEIAEESKEYLAAAAENSPEPLKEIVETFASSTDEFADVSKVRDFYVGIPYGTLLSLGGFISFMLTGSIPAIRFGVILGATILALSISSLRAWRKGETLPLVLVGQAVISSILFVRELRLWSVRPSIPNFLVTLISGGVAAFYLYRIITDGWQSRKSNVDVGPEN